MTHSRDFDIRCINDADEMNATFDKESQELCISAGRAGSLSVSIYITDSEKDSEEFILFADRAMATLAARLIQQMSPRVQNNAFDIIRKIVERDTNR